MKKYRVHVNGKAYEVAVEEIDAAAGVVAAAPLRAASPAPSVEPVPAAAGDEMIVSPMPGKIVSVAVKQGQTVREGDLIFILEAMKMENEVQTEVAGKVKEVKVKAGETVEGGQVLLVVEP